MRALRHPEREWAGRQAEEILTVLQFQRAVDKKYII